MKAQLILVILVAFLVIGWDCGDSSGCGGSTPMDTGDGGGGGGGSSTGRDSALVMESSDGGRTWYSSYTIDAATALYCVTGGPGAGLELNIGGALRPFRVGHSCLAAVSPSFNHDCRGHQRRGVLLGAALTAVRIP